MRRIFRAAGRFTLILGLLLGMVAARVLFSSRVELREGDARFAAGDTREAIDRWGRAARLYLPASPLSSGALARLASLSQESEAKGDRETALLAWREVRSAILATRSFYTPHRTLLDEANARIAPLAAALESPSVDPGHTEAERARWHAERLAEDDSPKVAWSLLALLGFAGFLGSALGFFFRGLDERDRLRPRAALAFGAGIVLGFALLLVGLARA